MRQVASYKVGYTWQADCCWRKSSRLGRWDAAGTLLLPQVSRLGRWDVAGRSVVVAASAGRWLWQQVHSRLHVHVLEY